MSVCGILGWVGTCGRAPLLPVELLAHRGPDDRGQEAFPARSGGAGAVLASTRLSILDLSSAGHMPMRYPGLPLAIAYNGEAYNFRELRAELERAGERFRTGTDTEAVLRGYRVWGDAVVERLRGMFAFALWDGRDGGRLLLARDRFGQKPLYYRRDPDGALWFSSELKALLPSGGPRDVDPESLAYYLDRGYPPPDRCMLRGYAKLPPGHVLAWEGGRLRRERYWAPPPVEAAPADVSRGAAAGALRELLGEAVRMRLVADVPVGALLSGGVDSASVVGLASRLAPAPLRTYTACFGAAGVDEGELARRTARHFGTRHRAMMINPRAGRLLPFIASHADEPIAEPSAVATYLICRRAREEVTVLLSSDGADELLLGYPRYRVHAIAQRLSTLPVRMRRVLHALLPDWPRLKGIAAVPQDPLLRDRYWLDHAGRRAGAFRSLAAPPSPAEAVRRVQCEDIASWLVEDSLMKLDKMSMAASVEVRAPFLDPVLAEWVLRLPVWTRMSWRRGKCVLRDAVRDLLPPHLRRRRKEAFLLPVDEWLRAEWRTMAYDVLLDRRARERGWTDQREVRRLLDAHVAGLGRHGRRLYQLLALEFWARTILDKGRAEPAPEAVDDCMRELPADRPVRKVAVIAPAGIGNTVRLTPAIRRLAADDPAVSVTLYTDAGRGSDEVMAGLAPVDRHVSVDFHRRPLRRVARLVRDLRRSTPEVLASAWVSLAAAPVGLLGGVRERSGWVPQWSRAARLLGALWRRGVPYDCPREDAGTYEVEAGRRLLAVEAGPPAAPEFAPPIWEDAPLRSARAELCAMPRPVLALAAAAAATIRQREYPLALMGQVVAELLEDGIVGSVAFLGDAAAGLRLGELVQGAGRRGLDLCGRLSVAGTAALMRGCDAVLAVDGGLLHLALTTDLPVLALYGPTDIFRTDPRGTPGRYSALTAFERCWCLCLPHRGIEVHPECREHARCLATIRPAQVVDAVATLVGRRQPTPLLSEA